MKKINKAFNIISSQIFFLNLFFGFAVAQKLNAQTSCIVSGVTITATGSAFHAYGTFADFCTPSPFTGNGLWSGLNVGGFVKYSFSSALTSADVKYTVVDGNPVPDIGQISVNGGGTVTLCNPCGFIITGTIVTGLPGFSGTASFRVSSTLPFTTITYTNQAGFSGNGVFQAQICEFVVNPVPCTVIPITLISFTATSNNCITTLRWLSANEINAKSYEIQSSSDGSNYTTVATQSAWGGPNIYTATTSSNINTFYRLKMNDLDGNFRYSNSIYQKVNCDEANKYELSPNPAKDFVQISGLKSGDIVSIFDMTGRQIIKYGPYTSGKMNIQSLFPGTYIVRLIIAKTNKVISRKMIKE